VIERLRFGTLLLVGGDELEAMVVDSFGNDRGNPMGLILAFCCKDEEMKHHWRNIARDSQ
jgi:hypothetical protein